MTHVTEVAAELGELENGHAWHQAGLIARYQASLARVGGVRSAVDSEGTAALVALVADIAPLLRFVSARKARDRFGTGVDARLLDDSYQEMVAVVLEVAADFDPERCASFPAWVTGKKGPARLALYELFDFVAGVEQQGEREKRALAIARSAEAEVASRLGRPATTPELQEAMWDYCVAYQYKRLSAEQQQLPSEQWREIVRKKLVNQGMSAAIRRIRLLQLVDTPARSAEEYETGWDGCSPVAEDDAPLEVSVMLDVALRGLDPVQRAVATQKLLNPTLSAAMVAVAFDRGVGEVRGVLARTTARMSAAHAHYAFLAPGVEGQFEAVPVGSRSALYRSRALVS